MSIVETVVNQMVGFILAVFVLVVLGPSFGIVGANIWNGSVLTAILTVLSVIRLYVLRRLFNGFMITKDDDDEEKDDSNLFV
jgi:membrane protein implicated in regulation of membrane protease activity